MNNWLEKGIIDEYNQVILNAAGMMTLPKSNRVPQKIACPAETSVVSSPENKDNCNDCVIIREPL